MKFSALPAVIAAALLLPVAALADGPQFRVAAYNVENYLDQPTESRRQIKSAAARAKVRETILAMKPDVLALAEMGGPDTLSGLRDSLKAGGLDLPYWEHAAGWDTNIHVCLLSRFPIVARRSHTNDTFLLGGRRFRTSRAFLEVDIQVNSNYTFTVLGAHLKSQLPVPDADQADLRLEEARLLREHIDARLAANPRANLVVLGDFNDTCNSKPIKLLIGRGRNKLVDTRPAERNGDVALNPINPGWPPRNVVWTHYYGVEDRYARIDYLLLSPGMAREWNRAETFIPTVPDWGLASDHRPLVATFTATDQ